MIKKIDPRIKYGMIKVLILLFSQSQLACTEIFELGANIPEMKKNRGM